LKVLVDAFAIVEIVASNLSQLKEAIADTVGRIMIYHISAEGNISIISVTCS
jgi:hypothetical protein